MRGLHRGAAGHASASRVAVGAALALSLAFALGACTIAPWDAAESGNGETTDDGGVSATAVPPLAIGASTLPATGAGAKTAPGFYRVKPGDTLDGVAKAYRQRRADLLSWNKLPADGKIRVGQLLRIAPLAATGGVPAAATPTPAAPAPARAKARFVWPIDGSVAQSFKGKSKGVVIAGPADQQVRAAAAGRVVYAGSGMKSYGKLVVVKHGANLVTAYGHNGKLLVKQGDPVKQGQPIAMSGTDGAGISALIFEVRENGKPVDPLAWLPKL
ncbi:MAG: peptidoglycan DD-metalloendopeptidase family protein [Paraburkholderia sp.]|nr:peptidoglycan DD-metalloendopeptidase family protein [Paraburkholderia sp.]